MSKTLVLLLTLFAASLAHADSLFPSDATVVLNRSISTIVTITGSSTDKAGKKINPIVLATDEGFFIFE